MSTGVPKYLEIAEVFWICWNRQLPDFLFLRVETCLKGTDLTRLHWSGGYVFILIPNILLEIMRASNGSLSNSGLANISWYNSLLDHSIIYPALLPQVSNLLLDAQGNPHPLLNHKEFRMASRAVQEDLRRWEFQKLLKPFCLKLIDGTQLPYGYAWEEQCCWCDQRKIHSSFRALTDLFLKFFKKF